MKLQRAELKKARIEIIPMIDTIFFLLVFFMISSLSMVRMKAIPVHLPQNSAGGAAGAASRPAHTVILTVTDGGGYYVNRAPIAPGDLGAVLQGQVAADPQAVVVLNLSKSQTTQTLIGVLDTLNAVQTPSGQAVRALIATEPVDLDGHALAAPAGTRK